MFGGPVGPVRQPNMYQQLGSYKGNSIEVGVWWRGAARSFLRKIAGALGRVERL